ncbi:MAG: hypothetical protein Kow0040_21610 [Thermogutta sp.]
MQDSSSTTWKFEGNIATCGGPNLFWSTDVQHPDGGVSLRASGGSPLPTDSEAMARVFALSLEGQPASSLRLCDAFAKANHLYSRYEDWSDGDPRNGWEIHLALTARRLAAETIWQDAHAERHRGAEEYDLEAVISARTENPGLERDVRIGFHGPAEEISWQGIALDDAERRTATVPIHIAKNEKDVGAERTADLGGFSFPLIGLPGSSSVLGLLVHPAGIRPLQLEESAVPVFFDFRDGRFSLEYRVFPLCLEKGVVVRSAFQLLLLDRAKAEERFHEAARRFLSSPPPLTEE